MAAAERDRSRTQAKRTGSGSARALEAERARVLLMSAAIAATEDGDPAARTRRIDMGALHYPLQALAGT